MTLKSIENGFPFECFTEVAEIESFRREIYRPPYYVHKWWARRLGSVFRAALIGACLPEDEDIVAAFYSPTRLDETVVLDPFMGSGTTIGEAAKLGCTAIGQDINPVAYRAVRVALAKLDPSRLQKCYERLERETGAFLRSLYKTTTPEGKHRDVLYYFWVKTLPCPSCEETVDLFSSYVFARHAYPARHPSVHVHCDSCPAVFPSHYKAELVQCPECSSTFDPSSGPARRTKAECRSCGDNFRIAEVASGSGGPPSHRMYAKLVLNPNGEKTYESITEHDLRSYDRCTAELERRDPPLPQIQIAPGHNTNQILKYGYSSWDQLFNKRQLLGLTDLASSIADLPSGPEREALACLFSGVLEFNNMFASYKGEGTGAVRHMFSHHILKPERTPLEANIWGTPKSSGAFSTLFKSRLLRAINYASNPFEIAVDTSDSGGRGKKVRNLSMPLNFEIREVEEFQGACNRESSVYLSCGSSAQLDLPDDSVDIVLTDPPFFDNVHYSELADFFNAWQSTFFDDIFDSNARTTRKTAEVQDINPSEFARKLGDVFSECNRVLKSEGLLVFSYHHSRDDGWLSVADAVLGSGFSVVAAQPVKSEMSVATPKSQAKEPIDIDVFLVCRPRQQDSRERFSTREAIEVAIDQARAKVGRFNNVGKILSRGDTKVILASELIVAMSAGREASQIVNDLPQALQEVLNAIDRLHERQSDDSQRGQHALNTEQLSLLGT